MDWKKSFFLTNALLMGTRDFQDNRRKSSVPVFYRRASRVAMGRHHEGMNGDASGTRPPANSQGSLEMMGHHDEFKHIEKNEIHNQTNNQTLN